MSNKHDYKYSTTGRRPILVAYTMVAKRDIAKAIRIQQNDMITKCVTEVDSMES